MLGSFVVTDFFLKFFFSLFFPSTLNLAYLAPLNGASQIFLSKLQLPKMPGKYQYDQILVYKLGNRVVTDFLVFSLFAPDKSL